ncbi:hypothetical protein AM501_00165 [Aneurinibacillus migulanus]|uniref:hypothetical protein n=1 Tax=Aneurinibacillus migulanus TaxID=47500 RepID=UPI0005BAF2E5|nr:hypothetical protein [Aneurinibacillus migulanus]KIV52533.1 hypothetical protein TS64_22240 [Aneurinibacillus migulanus]KPD10191.1 hypothetical protein AM501_00165 [Aneurinibacillus migulanus]
MQAVKVLISSFFDAILNEKSEYRIVFQNLSYTREWMPDTMYIGNYLDARTTVIISFDEDIDLGTITLAGGRLIGEHLKEWKEKSG